MKLLGFLPVSRRAMEILKARNPKLVQRPIVVHGPTGNYTRNAWILPEEAASERPRAAQFDLFDQGPRETAAKPAEENAAHTAESGEYEKRDKAFRDALQEQAKRSNKQLFGYDPDEEAAERKYQSTKNTLDAEHKRIIRYDEILKEHAAEKKSGNSGYSIKDRNYYKEKADEAKESMRWYRKNWPDQYARWSSETGSDPISSTGTMSAKAAKDSSRWEKMKGAGEFVLKFPDPESGSDMVYGRVYRFDHFNGRPPTYYTSDEKIFETLAEAKKYEWETRSLPDLIRDGYVEANMADNSESDRLEREIAKEHALRKKAAKALFDKAEKNGFDISPDRDPFKEAPRLHSSDVKRILKKLGTNLPTILSSPLQSYIMLVPLFGMYDGMYALKHRPSREELQKFAAEEDKPIKL